MSTWKPIKNTTLWSMNIHTGKLTKLHFRDGAWLKTWELVVIRSFQVFCLVFSIAVFGVIGAGLMRACCQ